LGLVQLDDVGAVLGRGRRGTAALRAALECHRPELARTLSALEERFLALCEDFGIPMPEVNVRICGYRVDALWRAHKLVVELDGRPAHSRPAAIERDRQRELTLREAGFAIRRYSWQQVTGQPKRVSADLLAALEA
jgi:hypothetical protein